MLGAGHRHGSSSDGALLEHWHTCSATVLRQQLASTPFSSGLGQPYRLQAVQLTQGPEAQAFHMHAADTGWCCMLPQTAEDMQAACTKQKLMLCMLKTSVDSKQHAGCR